MASPYILERTRSPETVTLETRLHVYLDGHTAYHVRRQVAAAYRLFYLNGWSESIYGHITARVPGEDDVFFINPFGLGFDEITASSLVKVDIDGNVVEEGRSKFGVNRAGYVLHSAIHKARSDICCIMHCHAPAGVAVSAQACGLLPISQTAHVVGPVSYHDYEGILVDEEEQTRLVQDLGQNKVMILRNHGLVTCGATVAEAYHRMFILIRACEIQVQALSSAPAGGLVTPSSAAAQKAYMIGNSFTAEGFGRLEFAADLRRLDHIAPGYSE